MRWYTHIIGMLSLMAVINRFLPLNALSIALAVIGSIAPDLIERMFALGHRNKYVHNFLTGAVALFTSAIIEADAFTFGLGYIHHLILDITRGGVFVGKKRVRGVLDAMNPLHNALVILLHLFLLLAAIRV